MGVICEIVIVPDPELEVRCAVRRVTRAIERGAKPDRIAIIYPGADHRKAQPYALMVRELLDDAGISWYGLEAGTLAQSACGRELLALLRSKDGVIPETQSWRQFSDDAIQLVDSAIAPLAVSAGWPHDQQSFAGAILERIRGLADSQPDAPIAWPHFRKAVQDQLGERIMRPAHGDNSVCIGTAEELTGRSFELLVMLGSSLAASSVGYSDGVLLASRSDPRAQQQRPLSNDVMGAASQLSGRRVAMVELTSERPDWPWLSVVPSFESLVAHGAGAASTIERNLGALLAWRDSGMRVEDHPLMREPILSRGVNMVCSRMSNSLTRFDGGIGEHEALSFCDHRPQSASSLERWATCPFSHFLHDVLRVGAGAADDDEEFGLSASTKGIIVHKVLEQFVKTADARRHPEQPWSAEDREALYRIADDLLNEALSAQVESGRSSSEAVIWRLQRRVIRRQLGAWLAMDEAERSRAGVLTAQAELSFGGSEDHIGPVQVPLSNGSTVMFRGQVDRVDRAPDGSRVMIVDYKTGRSDKYKSLKKDPVDGGRRLQLLLYALAARSVYGGDVPVEAAYWFLGEAAPKRMEVAVNEANMARLREVIGHMVDGIKQGSFPANPGPEVLGSYENCRHCKFNGLCPAQRAEAWERKRTDKAVKPVLALAGTKLDSPAVDVA